MKIASIDSNGTIRNANGCIIEDRRNEEQRKTHILAVVARDTFMSGWGQAPGVSRCCWAFDPAVVNSDRIFNWVKHRSEMRNVSLVDLRSYRPARNTSHFSVYVCDKDHVAANY